jgi:hypothetical protein
MNLADRIIACVEPDPAFRSIRLVGSRADGSATEFSDWDFRVEATDFAAAADALPHLLAPLRPLAQQWDRLSPEWCWMLIVGGPAKVDLIFPDEPHSNEPPWEPDRDNLEAIEAHFWDWMLWLKGKEASGKSELIASELDKLLEHLLAPLGVKRRPSSIATAIASYRDARDRAEQRLGVTVRRDLEVAVAPVFASLRSDGRTKYPRAPEAQG